MVVDKKLLNLLRSLVNFRGFLNDFSSHNPTKSFQSIDISAFRTQGKLFTQAFSFVLIKLKDLWMLKLLELL